MSEKKLEDIYVLKSKSKENQNLWLWNQVCETDPSVAKKVDFSSFKYTSICAQSQLRKATELFGSMGDQWGIKEETFRLITDGTRCMYNAFLFYPNGCIPIHADIEIIFSDGKRKGKYNENYSKIVATDALTKGLSKLGFNSDIFEGMFDIPAYIIEMKEKFKKKGLKLTQAENEEFAKVCKPVEDSFKIHRWGTHYKKIIESFGVTKVTEIPKAKETEVYDKLKTIYVVLQKELIANKIKDAPEKNDYYLFMQDLIAEYGEIDKITDAKTLEEIIKSLIKKFPK